MSRGQPKLPSDAERVVLDRDGLAVDVSLRPFSITLTRAGEVLLDHATVWVADGVVHDRFCPLTARVVAQEERQLAEGGQSAAVLSELEHGAELELTFHGGRSARLRLGLAEARTLALELIAEGDPHRLALEWERRPA
ncbi:MAG TPA: hypothetical protein VGI50_08110, partial [Solirubrobacteraceae bacterium]